MAFYNVNSENGNLIPVAGGTLYADTPIGTIIGSGVSASNPPAGYLYCDGRAVSRTTYAALFAAIGTAFGTGDGSTTFNLPDGREATFKGAGLTGLSNNHYDSDGVALGEFVEDRIQEHTHSIDYNSPASGTPGNGVVYDETTQKTNTSTNSGRSGATTEVKAFGVNFFIKATNVAVPADFSAQLPKVIMPDYARGSIYTTASTSYTCTEDCYVVFSRGAPNTDYRIRIDGNEVCSSDSISTSSHVIDFCGYVKKGSIIASVNSTSIPTGAMKVFGLA